MASLAPLERDKYVKDEAKVDFWQVYAIPSQPFVGNCRNLSIEPLTITALTDREYPPGIFQYEILNGSFELMNHRQSLLILKATNIVINIRIQHERKSRIKALEQFTFLERDSPFNSVREWLSSKFVSLTIARGIRVD